LIANCTSFENILFEKISKKSSNLRLRNGSNVYHAKKVPTKIFYAPIGKFSVTTPKFLAVTQ